MNLPREKGAGLRAQLPWSLKIQWGAPVGRVLNGYMAAGVVVDRNYVQGNGPVWAERASAALRQATAHPLCMNAPSKVLDRAFGNPSRSTAPAISCCPARAKRLGPSTAALRSRPSSPEPAEGRAGSQARAHPPRAKSPGPTCPWLRHGQVGPGHQGLKARRICQASIPAPAFTGHDPARRTDATGGMEAAR